MVLNGIDNTVRKMTDTEKNENPLKTQKWATIDTAIGNIADKNERDKQNAAYFQIQTKGQEVIDMLLQKNIQYGNSVLEPNRIFSKADASEQFKVRIDDKLNRLILGNDSMESDEDIIFDLIGYLILLLVHQEHYTRPLPEDDET